MSSENTTNIPWYCREPWMGMIVVTGLAVAGLSWATFLLMLISA